RRDRVRVDAGTAGDDETRDVVVARLDQRDDEPGVQERGCDRGNDWPVQTISSASRGCGICTVVFIDALYARAAATNDRKSGCGALGRDLYSGWNWQPTNQGCPSSSTISTNLPSGEMPVTWNPFSSSAGTYSGFTSYRWRCRSSTRSTPYASRAIDPSFRLHG